jgi:putative colanic acid biosynthesis acetyltransferase WcaF
MQTNLDKYDNSWYRPGSLLKRLSWYYVNLLFFKTGLFPFYRIKVFLLRCWGGRIGKGVLVKPFVNIKYPWFLEIGDHSWIGENVWIDNLDRIVIGKNVCISQGTLLLSGNHDYSKETFGLMLKPIHIEDGVWLGAGSMVTAGVTCSSHSVLAVNSVASSNMEAYTIYRGNPAVKVKARVINEN